MSSFYLDPDVLGTIVNEAGNQGDLGLQAVASVMRNRADQSGQTLRQVVSAPNQFEGYRPGSKLDPATAQRVAQVVAPILSGDAKPITDADSFYSPGAQSALGRSAPKWDDGSGVDFGGHRFFKTGYGGRASTITAGGATPALAGGDGASSAGDLDDILGPVPAGAAPAKGGDAVGGGDLDDIIGPAPAAAQPAGDPLAQPGADKGVLNADTGVAANDAQAHTLRGLQAAGKLNIDASNPGSGADNPMLSTDAKTLPGAGKWYIGLDGVVRQVPDKGLAIARADEATKQAATAKSRLPFIGDFDDAAFSPIQDEMTGGIAAGLQGLYNAGAHAFGAPTNVSMADRYQAAVEAERAAQDQRDKADPVAGVAGRIAGGLVVPPELGAGGGLGRAALQIGGVGAAYGAADARGGLSDRLKGAGVGAATSLLTAGALGAGMGLARAAPRLAAKVPVLDAIQQLDQRLAGGVNDALGRPFGAPPVAPGVVPAGTAPADAAAAARYVQGLQAGVGKSDAAIAASDAPTMAEAIGRPGVSGAAMLARRGGTSGDLADSVFLNRRDNRSSRILSTLSDASGVDPTFIAGDFAGQMAGLRKAAAPLYDAAYDVDPPTSTTLDSLMQRPSVQAAMPRAIQLAREEGRDPMALGMRDVDVAPPEPQAPNPADGPSFSDVLAGVRRGDDPKFNRGPSALQFIARNGGISDVGGDLAGMDAGQFHLNKPFMNKLINPAGDSADGWAVRLQENGYFPDMDPTTRPSIGDVHDLISDGLAGEHTYSRQADPAAMDLQARVSDLANRLRVVHDIHPEDLTGMSDNDVAQLVNAHDDGPHPYAPVDQEPAMSIEPSMQSYDYLKRALNDGVEGHRNPITGRLDDAGRAKTGTVTALRDELVRLNPKYGEALKAGGEPLRQEEAWRAAPDLMGDAKSEADFNKAYSAYTPAQRKAFAGGVVNHMYVKARQGRLDLRTLASPAMRAKLQTVFGADGAGKLGAMLVQEKAMIPAERAIPPGAGSPTMGLQQAAREADGGDQGLVYGLGQDALHALSAHPMNPAGAGGHFIARQLAKVPRLMQGRGMPIGVRNEAGRQLMSMSPADFQAFVSKLLPAAGPRPGLFGGSAPRSMWMDPRTAAALAGAGLSEKQAAGWGY